MSVLSYNITQQGVAKAAPKAPSGLDENRSVLAPTSNNNNNQIRKTFNKITVQNVLSENISNSLNISNNNANTIVRKIKDFGMIGSVNNASGIGALSASSFNKKRSAAEDKPKAVNKSSCQAGKKPKVLKDPLKAKGKALGEANAKPKALLDVSSSSETTPVRPAGTPGRKGLPLPQAVARRNARERNRVKQVNNGFAALRERIPEEVAEAFETPGSGSRGASKKLSKVETLRMAVEYIRSLERVLGFEFPAGGECGGQYTNMSGTSSGEDSFTMIKDEFDDLSPGLHDDHMEDSLSNYDMDDYFGSTPMNQSLAASEDDMLPNITTLNGLPYLRIPGTNTYQLIATEPFGGSGESLSPPSLGGGVTQPADDCHDDTEKYTPLIDPNCLSPGADATGGMELNSSSSSSAQPAPARANGLCVNGRSSSLSRSPVPQQQQQQQQQRRQQSPSSSPMHAATTLHQGDQQQQQQRATTTTTAAKLLSPAPNELASLQATCATTAGRREFVAPTPPHSNLPVAMIKQEFVEVDFATPTPPPLPQQQQQSPTGSTLMYTQHDRPQPMQQHQHQTIMRHVSSAMSPPLDLGGIGGSGSLVASMQTDALQSFYDHDPHGSSTPSFYEGVNIAALKKELLSNGLLDAASHSNALSDESMIEAIDWWEAHTPKSDSNSAIL